MGMKGKVYCPQVITFQLSASSLGLPSGSKASGCPIFSAASEKPSGTPSCVSPLMPSASICFHQRGNGIRPWLARIVRAFVPHHHGEEHAHAAAMEIRDHLAHAFDAAGHGLDHLELIAVVDAHVGIGGPDQHGIDAAIALFEIVEIAVDRVVAGDGVVEIAVLHHHLRLDEAGLGPLERRQIRSATGRRWCECGAQRASDRDP